MSAPNQGQSATKRITCANCGANNYVGGTHCWQCGKPLGASPKSDALASTLPTGPAPGASGYTAPTYTAPSYAEQVYAEPPIVTASGRPVQPIILPRESVDPDLAPKAAMWLGLIFPIIGIPVGMVFLMLDDARKIRLGWITIWWSVGGSVIGFILSLISLAPLMAVFHGMAPHVGGGAGGLNPLANNPDLSGGQ